MRGGAIIIGSLLWDNGIRQKWRDERLSLNKKFQVFLPIRYGRLSCGEKRKNTYTKVFSQECRIKEKLGKGWIIPIKAEINSFETLKTEASAMGKAEGFKNNSNLFSDWGSVALLLNPNKKIDTTIKENWPLLLSKNTELKCLINAHNKNETRTIDQSGFLTINWPKEVESNNQIDELDLLIATVTKPSLRDGEYPNIHQIADSMKKAKCCEYFSNNVKNGIATFQDVDIKKLLKDI